MTDFIAQIRWRHWAKNVLVFIPAIFGQSIQTTWPQLLLAFGAFCMVASSIYLLNDIADQEVDTLNPTKKSSGLNKQNTIYGIVALLLFATGFVYFLPDPIVGAAFLIGYFGLNTLYSFGGKRIPYLEMLFVVAGFVLRLFLGAQVSHDPVSYWLLAEVILLCLAIVLHKRIREMHYFKESGNATRKVLRQYSMDALKTSYSVLLGAILSIYIAYCFDTRIQELVGWKAFLSVAPVLLGIYRFGKLTLAPNHSFVNPVKLFFSDPVLISSSLLWIGLWSWMLYV